MDIMEEIKFPSKDSEWIQKVLIGGVVAIIPIVNLIACGYLLKVMRGAMNGKPGMPKWDDWENLFMNGLKAVVIGLIYLIIPYIIGSVSTYIIWAILLSGINTMAAAVVSMAGGFLITLPFALVFGFMLPMGMSMYVKENNFGAALRFVEVISRIKSVFGDYLAAYIVVIVVMTLLFSIWKLIGIPVLGMLIFIFGGLYTGVVASNMFGKVCARSKA